MNRKNRNILMMLLAGSMFAAGCSTNMNRADPTASNLVMKDAVVSQKNTSETRAANLSKKNISVTHSAKEINDLIPIDQFKPEPKRKQTVMVYMVGSDLESNPDGRNATRDISEMLDSKFDNPDVNIVINTGGSNTWWNGLPSRQNCYLFFSPESKSFKVMGEKDRNMAAQDVLTDFLKTTQEKFPADAYSIIFWDHGGGPLMGYGLDEKYEPENGKPMNTLAMKEIINAFDQSGFGKRKFDWIGFDACLMGSYEIASMLKPYTDRLIAAPETEPGCGWDYAFLNELNSVLNAADTGEAIVDAFASFLEENTSSRSNVRYSLVSYDLTSMPQLESAAKKVFEKLNGELQTNRKLAKDVYEAANATWEYGYKSGAGMRDLGQFINLLPETYSAEKSAFNEALCEVVSYGQTNIANTTGMSFYFPIEHVSSSEDLEDSRDIGEDHNTNAIGEYGLTLSDAFWTNMSGSDERNCDSKFVKEDSKTLKTYPIPDELKEKVVSASMTVFSRTPVGDGYRYSAMMKDLPVDIKNNELIVEEDVPLAMTTGENATLIPSLYIQENDGKHYYRTEVSGLSTGEEFSHNHIAPALLYFVHDVKNETSFVDSLRLVKEDGFSSMSTMKSDIGGESYAQFRVYMTWNGEFSEEQKFEPYQNRESSGVWYRYATLDEEFGVECLPLSEYLQSGAYGGMDFSYQLSVEDTNGDLHVIAFEDLDLPSNTATVKTAKGDMTFLIEEDQATLIRYSGTDSRLEIPGEVEGKPVKRIRGLDLQDTRQLTEITMTDSVEELSKSAFYGLSKLEKITLSKNITRIPAEAFASCSALKSVTLPDGIESIGDRAWHYSGLTDITIPSSVKSIGEEVFTDCKELKSISIEKDAPFKMDGPFLLDETGKSLLAFAPKAQSGTTIKIPNGVETISRGVFSNFSPEGRMVYSWVDPEDRNDVLFTIVLPEGLKGIAPYAFYDMDMDMNLALPDSLETIGAFAFADGAMFTEITEDDGTVQLGPNIYDLGYGCFANREKLKYVLDEGNNSFSLVNGKLTNLAGDTELSVEKDGTPGNE